MRTEKYDFAAARSLPTSPSPDIPAAVQLGDADRGGAGRAGAVLTAKTDATTCAVCGGDFTATRVVVEGKTMHPGCAVMSHGSHTHEDMANLGNRLWNLYEAALRFERDLSDYCDGPERDALWKALLETYDGWVYAPDGALGASESVTDMRNEEE